MWANPDGKTLSAEVHPGPIQLREDDVWKPIDTTVVERGGVLQTVRTKTPLTFGRGGDKTLVSAKAEHGSAGFGWTGRLPAPRTDGNKVIYPDAVAPGIDLVTTALANGFTQSVVIRQRPTTKLAAIKLPVTVPKGMTYGRSAGGAPQLRSAGGKPVTAGIVAQAMDANAELSPEQGHIREVATSLETSGNVTSLVLKPEATFLADPSVTYPVTLAVPSEWVGAGLADDAWVNKNDPSLNHLTDGWLRAGSTKTSADAARIYLRYLINDTDLDGATIENADLILWNYKSGLDPAKYSRNCATNMPAGDSTVARKLTRSWTPALLTWNNQPSFTSSNEALNGGAYSPDAGCSGGGELLYSIEPIVRAWAGGEPDHGLVVMGYREGILNWRQFYSKEGGPWDRNQPNHAPVLFVKYQPKPVKIATQGFVIPGPWDGVTPPSDTVIDEHLTDLSDNPQTPSLTEAEARSFRENAINVSMQDSRFGFYPMEDETQEEWLAGLDLKGETGTVEPDTSPPNVIATEPVANATDTPKNAIIRVTFDEPVTGVQLSLKDASGTPVAGSFVSEGAVATFTPSAPLTAGATITASVSGAADEDGNSMTSPHTWMFTVAVVASCTEPAWSEDEAPYLGGAKVSHKGHTWQVNEELEGTFAEPGTSDEWTDLGPCGDNPQPTPTPTPSPGMCTEPAWSEDEAPYLGGAKVSHNGHTWQVNEELEGTFAEPGTSDEWTDLGPCGDNPQPTPTPTPTPTYDPLCARSPAWVRGTVYATGAYVTHKDYVWAALNISRPGSRGEPGIDTSGWQSRGYCWSTVAGKRPSDIAARAQAAAKKFPYQRMTQEECINSHSQTSLSPEFWVKNSYNACYVGVLGERETANKIPTGRKWFARFSIVIHSYTGVKNSDRAREFTSLNSRQIKAWVRIDSFRDDIGRISWPTSRYRNFSLHLNNSNSCDNDQPNGIADTVDSWLKGGDRSFTLTSLKGKFPAPEYRGMCGIQPSVFYIDTDPVEERAKTLADKVMQFRCDSSDTLKNYTGGCVAWSQRPTWILDGNQTESAATADHIWKALYDPRSTDPKFPGQTKKIPGRVMPYNHGCDGHPGCLTRATGKRETVGTVPYLNDLAKDRACRKVPRPTSPALKSPSCDEYPFASTHEGLHKAGINFSVAWVEGPDNCSGGAKLVDWYQKNRILEGDPFWVDVVKKGSPPPPDVVQSDTSDFDFSACDDA
ncbi:DNRLRE domain-containing protein [Nonomuraea sp. RK-328]|nr:DNRLRE domain-containing protein [Nonomuraea sp. RK-328]